MCMRRSLYAWGTAMDEESVGILGVLLIVTALVLSQSLHKPPAMPALPDVKWEDIVSVLGCSQSGGDDCRIAMNE
jgi:hypothetical protein